MQKSHSHRFALDMSPAEAFQHFTAEGERVWIEDWNPVFIHCERPETTSLGTVWETGESERRTLWMCIDWQSNRRVRYARVMPAARFDIVEVVVDPMGGGSSVTVTYTFTPLTKAAQADVKAIDAARFARMIGEWPRLILGSSR